MKKRNNDEKVVLGLVILLLILVLIIFIGCMVQVSAGDIAKASDYVLKFQVNVTFALARIDEDTVSISARSKGFVDVSKIMELFGGGGSEHSAAAQVKGQSIEEIKNKLNEILISTVYLESNVNQENTNSNELLLTKK